MSEPKELPKPSRSCRCHVKYALDAATGVQYCPRCHTPRRLSKSAEAALREMDCAK
jgi:hypothetical protein